MIPKVIYVYYDRPSFHDILKENIDYLKKQNPDYKVKIITPYEVIQILTNDKPEWIYYFNKINRNFPNLQSDYIRYVLLYLYGGIYIDIKSRPKKPLSDIIDDSMNIFLLKEELKGTDIATSFLVSKPKHIIFEKVIEKMNYNIDNYWSFDININTPKINCLKLFGPKMLGKIVDENINLINDNEIIPSKYYYKYLIFSFVNTTGKRWSIEHHKLYEKPHYSKVKEHLIYP